MQLSSLRPDVALARFARIDMFALIAYAFADAEPCILKMVQHSPVSFKRRRMLVSCRDLSSCKISAGRCRSRPELLDSMVFRLIRERIRRKSGFWKLFRVGGTERWIQNKLFRNIVTLLEAAWFGWEFGISLESNLFYKWIVPRCKAVITACVRSFAFSRIRMTLT